MIQHQRGARSEFASGARDRGVVFCGIDVGDPFGECLAWATVR